MKKTLRFIESALVIGILGVISFILILSFIDILYEIKQKVIMPPRFIIDANGLMDLFSTLLVLMIGLKLLETVKTYLKEDIVHVEIIIKNAIFVNHTSYF